MSSSTELAKKEPQTEPAPQTAAQADSKNKKKEDTISFFTLFRFATTYDWILIIIGSTASIANGAAMPLFSLLFGAVADGFGPTKTHDEIMDTAADLSLQLFLVGIGTFVASYFGFACWMISGERQAIEIRKRYFKSLLSQEIAFFDSMNPNEFATKVAEECFNIQSGIGEKVSTFLYSMSMFVVGFIIGYIKGWQLSLILTGFMPFLSITGGFFVFAVQKATTINNEAYSKAGAISEEVLNAIRTVVSLGGQEKEVSRYKGALNDNRRTVTRFGIFSGLAMGSVFLAMFGMYALGFFVGSIFINNKVNNPVTDEPYSGGDVLTVFFSLVMAGFTFAQAAPAVKAFAIAKASGTNAFKIIDRKSKIDIENPAGMKPAGVTGDIKFNNVSFAYPLKQEKLILDGISFSIRPNEKTAFVGESGCGKTTCMQLIERFYDIENGNGSITLDGNELKDLNLKWMRGNIGYVGQEPVLFATTIKANILMAKEDATDAEIWEALKKANAYDFVQGLPDKLDTFVGNSGTQLSGGQKQRLAIARAILKDPKILLLDEATSALDRKNEVEIQKTLDEISEGRTTIVIAHRLTTIINADHIIVFDQGKVVEEGRHAELIANQGKYYALQHLQLQSDENKKNESGSNEDDLPPEIDPITKQPSKHHNSARKASASADVHIEVKTGTQKVEEVKDDKAKKGKEKKPPVFGRLFKYNQKDIPLTVFGVCIAALNGCVFPSLAIVLSEMLEVFALPDAPDFKSRANLLSLMFLVLAIVSMVLNSIQMSVFSIVAENLSRKIRAEIFTKYIKNPIAWFDLPENSPGALGSKLAKDASLINSLTSSVIGLNIQAVSSFIAGMIIAFIASWQLTLISLAVSPLMVIAGMMQAKFSQGFSASTDDAYKESATFVSEAVCNMRTVASFGKEDQVLGNYALKLEKPLKMAFKKGNYSGLSFAFSQFVNFGIYALVFYVGALFITNPDSGVDFQGMLQSIFGIMFAAMGAGNAMQFAPDVGAATNAAIDIFKILDSVPAIDIDDPKQTVRTPVVGNIEFKNVWFKYPSREKQILKGLNLKINASTKVALVGPSGCGKSTVLALLQRFYDVDQGEILIDGVNIKDYDLRHLRNYFGVVSQEPVLFNGTIEYNIKYAKEDATDAEMRSVAERANALGFIESNEFDVANHDEKGQQGTGFQRKVGPKGSQLSGGQKQRIAIARAILKNPSVLILDEATSALDSQNEKAVQESLDKIMEGKTSVIVAHRISTIKDSDEIIVFHDGDIVEKGNYQTLTAKQGVFYKLEHGLDLNS